MKPKWTQEKPTKPGFYWIAHSHLRCVKVVRDGGELIALDGDLYIPIRQYTSSTWWQEAVVPDPPIQEIHEHA